MRTCLWFDDQAVEAANFYTRVLRDGKVGQVVRYPKSAEGVSGKPAGSVMTVAFEVEGHEFLALNGGPMFQFTEAISLIIERDTQQEIDEVWAALAEGGTEQPGGWIKDQFGVSWQVVPSNFTELTVLDDGHADEHAFEALIAMKKLDIEALRAASRESVGSA